MSLCGHSAKREFTSFDTPNVAAVKARYIRDRGLGGAMYWELDAVRPPFPSPTWVDLIFGY
jgi:GH18 family chitinase